ncbi:hypothetical protein V6N13_144136 [Hibiscus sabdariffa]|uniref:Pectinesterase catalytic domain-containing protein n=1 Tax=Hibiscus sabdariffa TaxID=183260 RepID=A0ABR2FK51_9ROSI
MLIHTLEELNTTEHFNTILIKELRVAMQHSSEYASNSLAIVAKILVLLTDFNILIRRRLLGFRKAASSEFPAWISPTERRLFQESKPTPNVTVAKDDSGHFKAFNDAMKLIYNCGRKEIHCIALGNTAGAAKHQAVAMHSQSDRSVFYRCAFNAYQDMLYAHSNSQFYKECDILGTMDFIFGNAVVVFQSCNILPRQPLRNQFNTITAQGKENP